MAIVIEVSPKVKLPKKLTLAVQTSSSGREELVILPHKNHTRKPNLILKVEKTVTNAIPMFRVEGSGCPSVDLAVKVPSLLLSIFRGVQITLQIPNKIELRFSLWEFLWRRMLLLILSFRWRLMVLWIFLNSLLSRGIMCFLNTGFLWQRRLSKRRRFLGFRIFSWIRTANAFLSILRLQRTRLVEFIFVRICHEKLPPLRGL